MVVCLEQKHGRTMSNERDENEKKKKHAAAAQYEANEATSEKEPPTEATSEPEPRKEEPGEEPGGERSAGGEDLLRKLDEMSAEATEYKERYLRTVADLENYRKRAVREKEEARKQGISSLLEDLLPVLDNFQLGLKSAEMHDGGSAFAEGFRMVLKQMQTVLTDNGLVPLSPDGESFDPNYHECVAHLPHGTVEEGHIIEVQRVGYRYQERLLRPAVVVVSSGPERESGEGSADSADSGKEQE